MIETHHGYETDSCIIVHANYGGQATGISHNTILDFRQ